jgi:SHAQKYF class myb-like DNA-binding protein
MNKSTWTPSEHGRFLLGLRMYGPGKWSKIAKKCVLTRTPTQVASHAQKYHKRMVVKPEVKRRKSIFDPVARYPGPEWYKKYCNM